MRLIDADAFTEYVFDKWIQNDISNGDWTTFREWMNLQETVVEFDGDINRVMVKGIEYFPQKTGHWIYKNGAMVSPWYSSYECSECGCLSGYFKYCPECGSRNRGEEE